MKRMKKRVHFKIAAFGLALLLGTGATLQVAATSAKETSTTSLKEAESEKQQLEKELADAKDAIEDLKQSKGNVESKISALNSKLMDISERITTLEGQLEEKNNNILQTQQELEDAEATKEQQYEDMKLRIQFMYENSNISYMQLLLEAKDISSLLNSVEYITEIQQYDRKKLEEFTETVTYIAGVEEQLKQDYEELQQMKTSVEEEKASVAALMKQKETELAGIADDIVDAQSEAEYYAAELQAQEELIAEIKRIEAEKAAAQKQSAPYTGGVFVWPCPSSMRVTSGYGNRTSPTSGASTYHRGIDIGAAGGADIVAAAAGTVTSAAYSSAAGNYVMIDHGGGLYTVYMHASEIVVSPGQQVSPGQVIAKVGSTGISTGNHLHFAVSLNGSYVNPGDYLGG